MNFVKSFKDISLHDVGLVGGKNASLGHMIRFLEMPEITIPQGFAITSHAYNLFLQENNLELQLRNLLTTISNDDYQSLSKTSKQIRSLFQEGKIPAVVQEEIITAYQQLSKEYSTQDVDVAVRSSATAEDLPEASFAGQQETFLNIKGTEALLDAYKKCLASLFTDRAILYRTLHGFDHMSVGMSVGVQKMVRSDLASSGVAFSLDPETGNRDIFVIEAVFGLGELLVQGNIIPDEYRLYAPHVKRGFQTIISKKKGDRTKKLRYGTSAAVKEVPLNTQEQQSFCLTNDEIFRLAQAIEAVQESYSAFHGVITGMDIEWAKDGIDGKLYLIQARPETIHTTQQSTSFLQQYVLKEKPEKYLISGQSIGQRIASGNVQIVTSLDQAADFKKNSVLVTHMTNPDWLPLMKKAAAIITDVGGRTCHAAIVSRELGIPAIVGTGNATKILETDQLVTVDCSQGTVGYVYDGQLSYSKKSVEFEQKEFPPIDLMVNLADPAQAFSIAKLPGVAGIGLARIEFIIANQIKIHPMACAHFDLIHDRALQQEIREQTAGYEFPAEFFIQSLVYGIGTLAAAMYPRPVVVRFSDFKTNEYAQLLGGSLFEQQEQNPMLGLRGASRYYSASYQAAFVLECEAIRRVHNVLGFTNVVPMIPFVRTPQEAQKVLAIMEKHGLDRHKGFKIFMMIEIPSNVLLFDEYASLFDGFSIGSNDLTQFTLAVDRDSSDLASLFDERDPAVQKMIRLSLQAAHTNNAYLGICGQAPSDYPEFAQMLIDEGISSISLNPDSFLHFLTNYKK